jgi:hypothetical protein
MTNASTPMKTDLYQLEQMAKVSLINATVIVASELED